MYIFYRKINSHFFHIPFVYLFYLYIISQVHSLRCRTQDHSIPLPSKSMDFRRGHLLPWVCLLYLHKYDSLLAAVAEYPLQGLDYEYDICTHTFTSMTPFLLQWLSIPSRDLTVFVEAGSLFKSEQIRSINLLFNIKQI